MGNSKKSKKTAKQIIYFQRPNVLSLSESLDATRILNIGKTSYDSEENLKRMYPMTADKLRTDAWILIDYFEICDDYEKKANDFFGTKGKDMDKSFHNYIKANCTDWIWVDPNEYQEINGSTEIFIYIGPKQMESAIKDLIQKLKDYHNNIKDDKEDFYGNIYDDSKKTVCSREMITKIAKLTAFLVYYKIIANGTSLITSENDRQNIAHLKSIWYNDLYGFPKYIKLVIDIINGNIYLYLKQPSNKVCEALCRRFQDLKKTKHAEPSGIAYLLVGNLIGDRSEDSVKAIAEKIKGILDFTNQIT